MAHINRKYIDKHWWTFLLRGALAIVTGGIALFGNMSDLSLVVSYMSIFLLLMGIIDASSALYSSTKKRGWFTALFDSAIDIIAAVALLFAAHENIAFHLTIIALYVLISGVIDLIHAFVSTVDPTDRFIRIIAGVIGAVMGFVIFNAGSFEIMTFIRFFGSYMLIVGVCSLIYGVHNHAQNTEDKIARKESAAKAKTTKKAKASKKSK